jgi:uncharacterized membrane protein YedE/YeeE
MKLIKFLFIGILFGIILTKSEVISWFRIQEMFRFQSFYMYGVIGTAVIIGIIGVLIIKKMGWKSIDGTPIDFTPKKMEPYRVLLGGTVFGLGWAMTGACPGPLYALFGQGIWVIAVVIISGLFGAFIYGILKPRLPH